jgi:TRAP-type C4-dicarboxylate transport system permease small subunit
VLTHWFYLYLPWFFPFAAFAVLAPAVEPLRAPVRAPLERPRQELVGVD